MRANFVTQHRHARLMSKFPLSWYAIQGTHNDIAPYSSTFLDYVQSAKAILDVKNNLHSNSVVRHREKQLSRFDD